MPNHDWPALITHLDEPVTLDLPASGGYEWTLTFEPEQCTVERVEPDELPPAVGSVFQRFRLTPHLAGRLWGEAVLARPWDPRPLRTMPLALDVRVPE